MCDSYAFGRVMKEGIHVALVGLPNTGKSSLLNYFLKENRAIVSDIPGTTRDIIREELHYEGLLFHLFDTAGIRDAQDVIEQEGIEDRSIQLVDGSFALRESEGGTVVTLTTRYRPLLQARVFWRPFEQRLTTVLHDHVLDAIERRVDGT